MSFKRVKELRKSGDLVGALDLAKLNLEDNPGDLWSKRALAWVLYDFIKANSSEPNFDEAKTYIEELIKLEMGDQEDMLFSNLAYQIGKLMFSLVKTKGRSEKEYDQLLNLCKEIPLPKQDKSYSFLFKSFHNAYKDSYKYIELCNWWDLNNFIAEDFEMQNLNDRNFRPLAEQAYNNYSKILLKGKPLKLTVKSNTEVANSENEMNGFEFYAYQLGVPLKIENEKVRSFIPELNRIIELHPEFEYALYYKFKLMQAINHENINPDEFLPFLRSKKNEFWAWELLSDLFTPKDNRKIGCLCKAISLGNKEDFKIKLRIKLAELLIEQNLYDHAKCEINRVIELCENNNWKLSDKVKNWQQTNWYDQAQNLSNNSDLYNKYKSIGEELIYSNIDEYTIVIEFVNSNKKIANFLKDEKINGFFKYKGHIKNPKIGEIYKARLKRVKDEKFFRILSIKKQDENTSCYGVKKFSGELRIITPSNIGFVDDVFINPAIIKKEGYIQGQEISGKAILSFNKKKSSWGWKAI